MRKAMLLSGLGGTSDCWPHLFTGRLESAFTVDRFQLPENGSTIGDFAENLRPLEHFDLLIGYSVGSAVIQEILCTTPDLTAKVVLMAPPAGSSYPPSPEDTHDFSDGRGRWSAKMLEMMFTPEWLAAHPDVTEYFPRVKKPVTGERLIVQSNAIEDWPGRIKDLQSVTNSVLVIGGLFDIITPIVHAYAVQEALPESEIEVMETGHGFPWQCPVETADRILEFAE